MSHLAVSLVKPSKDPKEVAECIVVVYRYFRLTDLCLSNEVD